MWMVVILIPVISTGGYEDLHDLMEQDLLPIVYPIGMDDNGDAYNINADEAASAIATALKAEKLAYLSDVEGVRLDPEDPSSVISELYVEEAEKLVEEGVIKGGMLPKIRNCIRALGGWSFPDPYHGWTDPSQPSAGILHKQGYRYSDHTGKRGEILE